MLGGLFVDPAGAKPFTALYRGWIEDYVPFPQLIYLNKTLILQLSLSSELQMLSLALDRLAQQHRWSRDFTLHSLRRVLREVIACFPVYRSYIAGGAVHDADRRYIDTAIRAARLRNPTLNRSHFDFLRDMLLLQHEERATDDELTEQQRFAGQFQQVTAPVMAKGLEDTTFYVYNRLTSLNEVGGDPLRFGIAPATLHQAFALRQQHLPHALSTTSTHDTKRSEDVRARINVLSEMPGDVARMPGALERDERSPSRRGRGREGPRLGTWSTFSTRPCSAPGLWNLMTTRNTPSSSSAFRPTWRRPPTRPRSTQAGSTPTPTTTTPCASSLFASSMSPPAAPSSPTSVPSSGASLAMAFSTRWRRACSRSPPPASPDMYQGTELWDFSLVDPDNRRPVDYEKRRRVLGNLLDRAREPSRRGELVGELLDTMADGRIKLYVTAMALRCRREHPGLFSSGSYSPVEVGGPRAEHVFSFVRRHGERAALVAVPRLVAKLLPDAAGQPYGPEVWGETMLMLPEELAGRSWRSLFTGEILTPVGHRGQHAIPCALVFGRFPVALLLAHSEGGS